MLDLFWTSSGPPLQVLVLFREQSLPGVHERARSGRYEPGRARALQTGRDEPKGEDEHPTGKGQHQEGCWTSSGPLLDLFWTSSPGSGSLQRTITFRGFTNEREAGGTSQAAPARFRRESTDQEGSWNLFALKT